MIIGNRIINHKNCTMYQTRFNTIIVIVDETEKYEFLGACDNNHIDAIWLAIKEIA